MQFRARAKAVVLPHLREQGVNSTKDELEIAARNIGRKEILNGVLVKSVSVPAAGAFKINHKLGRKPLGVTPVWWSTAPLGIYMTGSDTKYAQCEVAAPASYYANAVGAIATDGTGNTTSSFAGAPGAPGWSAARTGVGIYVVSMADPFFTAFHSGTAQIMGQTDADNASVSAFATGAGAGAQIRTYVAGAAANVVTGTIWFSLWWTPNSGATVAGQTADFWVF